MHITCLDATSNSVPDDFGMKYGIAIEINELISIEEYIKILASKVGNNAILFANKKNGKLIVYFQVYHMYKL